MKLVDVKVVNFDFSGGIRNLDTRALARFTFEERDEAKFIWVALTPQETDAVTAAARAVEQRFLSEQTPIPTEDEGDNAAPPPEVEADQAR